MNKSICFNIVLIFCFIQIFPQNYITRFRTKDFKSSFATEKRQLTERNKFNSEIENVFNKSFSEINYKDAVRLFKEVKLKYIRSEKVKKFLKNVLSNFENQHEKLIYEVLETAYTLFPFDLENEVRSIYNKTTSQKIFALSAKYLILNNVEINYLNDLNKRFSNYNTILRGLEYELNKKNNSDKPPPILDLLTNEFQSNKTVIFSFHRKNRNYPGLTVIRTPKGEFVRDKVGKIISVKQLAKSATNLPGYFRRGNTPQGIYSVQGYYLTETESIGPSPIVITRIPFEVTTSSFFHNREKGGWSIEKYLSLFPASWKDYFPMTEAYRAGEIGRRLIIMHGSADDLSYYTDLPHYPLTPSLGCLTTIEIWDKDTGELLESDQLKLMNSFYNSRKLSGFLVVVELDDKSIPVELEEIKSLLLKAEKILKSK